MRPPRNGPRLYRRNADSRVRRLERSVAAGDPQAHVALLQEYLRMGVLSPERISMAAYLGNPAARAVGLPPPPGPGEVTWVRNSRAHEILDRAAIAPRHATLFAADCATRALVRSAGYGDSPVYAQAHEVIALARAWVLGDGQADPAEAARAMWESPEYRRLDLQGSVPGSWAVKSAEVAGYGARQPPKEWARSLFQYTIWSSEHLGTEGGREPGDPARSAAADQEVLWQDAHLANALLSPSWPMVLA